MAAYATSVLVLVLLAVPVQAQPAAQRTGLELDTAAGQYLSYLQESWLQWMSAYYQDRPEEASGRIDDVRASLEHLGFERLPDLSMGAAARAVESARFGNLERARWGLEAAERLDRGRPETSFAWAILAWEDGDWLGAAGHHLVGWARLVRLPAYRLLWAQGLLLAALATALLAGGAFVLVTAAVYGQSLFCSIGRPFARLPPGVSHALTWALLLWPLLLPGGPVWLLLYLSALLTAFAGWSVRLVIAGLWLILGVTPVLVAAQERKLEIALSPPAHAVRALVERRLYGGFFSDLAVLRSALPESTEVVAIVGDLHRGMGQWEPARERYEQVLLEAPEDVASLVNLGVYYFRRGDYASAIQHFNRAAGLDSRNAAAFFNLSQAYSESYLFTEQRLALSRARDIDEWQVSRWLGRDRSERVVTVDMRSQRSQAIMAQLEAGWRAQEPEALTVRRYVSLGLPLGALALALVLAPLLPIGGSPVAPSHGGTTPRALRIAVPGLESIAAGEGGRAYLALLGVAACLVLALGRGLGYSIPWGISPGEVLPTVLGVTGLVAFYGARIWWDFRTRI